MTLSSLHRKLLTDIFNFNKFMLFGGIEFMMENERKKIKKCCIVQVFRGLNDIIGKSTGGLNKHVDENRCQDEGVLLHVHSILRSNFHSDYSVCSCSLPLEKFCPCV